MCPNSVNCLAVICSPNRVPYIYWRVTTSDTMAPGPFFYIVYNLVYLLLLLLACWSVLIFTVLANTLHTIRLTLYFQQDGKLDNLPGTLGQGRFVCCV